jgi:hypothetical protein
MRQRWERTEPCGPIIPVLTVTLEPNRDAVVEREFDHPFNFGIGTDFTPRGWDAFVVDVPQ